MFCSYFVHKLHLLHACKQAQGSHAMHSARAGYIDQAHPPVAPLPLWSCEHTPSRVGHRRCLSLSGRSRLRRVPCAMGGVSFPPNASEGSLCVPSCPSGVGNTRPGFAATPRISRARKPRAGFCQLPPGLRPHRVNGFSEPGGRGHRRRAGFAMVRFVRPPRCSNPQFVCAESPAR